MQSTQNTRSVPVKYPAKLGVFLTRLGWLIRPGLIFFTMIVGDALVTSWRPKAIPQLYWGLLDSPVHIVLALLVGSPLLAHPDFRERKFRWIVIAGLVAFGLDLDHLVAARSFSLYEIQHLPVRPPSHSLLFAFSCGLVAFLSTRRAVVGWLVFGALASHVIRDASSGSTLFLWPLRLKTLPISVYYTAQISLYLAMSALTSDWLKRGLVWVRSFWRHSPGHLVDQPGCYRLD